MAGIAVLLEHLVVTIVYYYLHLLWGSLLESLLIKSVLLWSWLLKRPLDSRLNSWAEILWLLLVSWDCNC